MTACAEEYYRRLRNDRAVMNLVRAIQFKTDRNFISKWGLILQEADDLEDTWKNFEKLNLIDFITSLNDSFEGNLLRG